MRKKRRKSKPENGRDTEAERRKLLEHIEGSVFWEDREDDEVDARRGLRVAVGLASHHLGGAHGAVTPGDLREVVAAAQRLGYVRGRADKLAELHGGFCGVGGLDPKEDRP